MPMSTLDNISSVDMFESLITFGGYDSVRIRNSHSEFSELTGLSRIPGVFPAD